jgi:hypothetical protein
MHIKDFCVGMVVITPNSIYPGLTAYKKYIIQDVQDEWIRISDDTGQYRYYQSFLFMEPDIYHTMCLYMSISRILGCGIDISD